MEMMLVYILVPFIISVQSWSTLDRTDKSFGFYRMSNKPIQECQDKLSSEVCKKYKELCDKNIKITDLCRKTCEDCPAVSPMSCHASKHGCCWDGITVAGANKIGCPECADKSASCGKIFNMCDKSHIQRYCPITCKVEECKSDLCIDDPGQAEFCPMFKSQGMCVLDPILMSQFCKKTCELCHTKQPEIVIPAVIEKKVSLKDEEENLINRIKHEINKEKKEIKDPDDALLDILVEQEKKKVNKKEASDAALLEMISEQVKEKKSQHDEEFLEALIKDDKKKIQ